MRTHVTASVQLHFSSSVEARLSIPWRIQGRGLQDQTPGASRHQLSNGARLQHDPRVVRPVILLPVAPLCALVKFVQRTPLACPSTQAVSCSRRHMLQVQKTRSLLCSVLRKAKDWSQRGHFGRRQQSVRAVDTMPLCRAHCTHLFSMKVGTSVNVTAISKEVYKQRCNFPLHFNQQRKLCVFQ